MAQGQTLTCMLWAAIIDQNGIPQSPRWNGDPDAYPGYIVTGTAKGGANFAGDQIPYPSPPPSGLFTPPRTPLFLTLTGSTCAIKINTGQDQFAISNGTFGKGGSVPGGYFPGWPDQGGRPAQLDVDTIVEPATLNTPYIVNFPGPVAGSVQVGFPHSIGNFYVEYTMTNTTTESEQYGAGIARAGVAFPYLSTYEFSVDDSNGGAGVNGDLVLANGNEVGFDISNGGIVGHNTIVGLAISIFPPPAVLVPVDFHPLALKCTPCDGILARRAQRKASASFG